MYIATIYPNRISIRYDHDQRTARKKWEDGIYNQSTRQLENLRKKKTSWTLSYQSKRKIFDSVNYMNTVAPRKTIKTKSGKLIYNFKTSFITLTLPTKQKHSDLEIKNCLNTFLTNLREQFSLKNYVWKAELQQNENIHFHLVIDQYIHHQVIRYYWNRAINTLGYVDEYRETFEKMDLQEYAAHRGITVQKAINGFLAGRKSYWNNPPTENIQAVRNEKMLSYYIGKYLTKSGSPNDGDVERIQAFGRVWARSQSLSRIQYITRYIWSNLQKAIKAIDTKLESFTVKKYDYVTILYLRGTQAKRKISEWMKKKMVDLATTYNYPIPET